MRVYSREFRIQVVRRILAGERIPALAEELKIHRKLLYEWLRRVNQGGESSLRERGRPRKGDASAEPDGNTPRQMAELERRIAHQRAVIEFLLLALRRLESRIRKKQAWRQSVFEAIQEMMERKQGLSVEKMCDLTRIARSGYYRYLRARLERDAGLAPHSDNEKGDSSHEG